MSRDLDLTMWVIMIIALVVVLGVVLPQCNSIVDNVDTPYTISPYLQTEYLVIIDSTAMGDVYYKCNIPEFGVIYLNPSQTILYGEVNNNHPRIVGGKYDQQTQTYIPLKNHHEKIEIYVPLRSINNEKNIKVDIQIKR